MADPTEAQMLGLRGLLEQLYAEVTEAFDKEGDPEQRRYGAMLLDYLELEAIGRIDRFLGSRDRRPQDAAATFEALGEAWRMCAGMNFGPWYRTKAMNDLTRQIAAAAKTFRSEVGAAPGGS